MKVIRKQLGETIWYCKGYREAQMAAEKWLRTIVCNMTMREVAFIADTDVREN
jgi:hypothetical protein